MQSNDLPKKVLFIDDDVAVSESLEGPLRGHGVQLIRALDLETALYHFNQQIFEVICVELEFGPLPGLALVQKIRNHPQKERRMAGIILTSGQQRKATDDGLMGELGDIELVNKPLSAIKLLPVLQKALDHRRVVTEFTMVQEQANSYLASDGIEPAIELIKRNLPKLKQRGLSLMVNLYEEAQKYPEALSTVDSLLEKSSSDINLVNTKGRILMKMGEFDQAREYMEKADAAAPQNIERLKAMAEMYLKLQDPDASVDRMKEIIDLCPEEKDLKFSMFRNLEDAGFMSHAVSLCKSTTPPVEVVRYYNNIGVMLSKKQDFAGAIKEYETALKFYPTFKENYRIHFNIGLAYAHLKTTDGFVAAEKALMRCLELKSGYEKAETMLAEVRKRLALLQQRSAS